MDTIRGSERIGNKADDDLYINFIATGQGDCIFIKTPLGRTILIDAGSDPAEQTTISSVGDVIFRNERLGIDPEVNVLDLLIITHPDHDHYNRLMPLVFQPVFHRLRGNTTQEQEDKNIHDQLLDRDDWPYPQINKVLISISPLKVNPKKKGNLGPFGAFGGDLLYHHGTKAQLEEYFPLDKFPKRNQWNPSGLLEEVALNTPELAQNGPMLLIHETLPDGREFKYSILAAGVQEEPSEKRSTKKRGRDGVELSPTANYDANALSIVTLLEYGPDRILLMGDANRPVELFLSQHFRTQIKDLELIQLPHHGSNHNAMRPSFTQLTNSKLVVCSAAKEGNVHGLPRVEAILQYAEHAEPSVPRQGGQDHANDVSGASQNESNYIFCWLGQSSEVDQSIKKRKGTNNEVYINPVNPSTQFPEGFTSLHDPEEDLSRYLWIYGKLLMQKNVHVTGSLKCFHGILQEHIMGSNIELEFGGK